MSAINSTSADKNLLLVHFFSFFAVWEGVEKIKNFFLIDFLIATYSAQKTFTKNKLLVCLFSSNPNCQFLKSSANLPPLKSTFVSNTKLLLELDRRLQTKEQLRVFIIKHPEKYLCIFNNFLVY